jgi:hypothetical protein
MQFNLVQCLWIMLTCLPLKTINVLITTMVSFSFLYVVEISMALSGQDPYWICLLNNPLWDVSLST